MKALVIDDNKEIADSMVRMLSFLDIDAEAVYGSSAAMILLNAKKLDLVFLDINMPGVTGFDVLGFINREPRLKSTKVVVVSSEDQTDTVDRAYQLGAKAYIRKPVTLEALEEAINAI